MRLLISFSVALIAGVSSGCAVDRPLAASGLVLEAHLGSPSPWGTPASLSVLVDGGPAHRVRAIGGRVLTADGHALLFELRRRVQLAASPLRARLGLPRMAPGVHHVEVWLADGNGGRSETLTGEVVVPGGEGSDALEPLALVL